MAERFAGVDDRHWLRYQFLEHRYWSCIAAYGWRATRCRRTQRRANSAWWEGLALGLPGFPVHRRGPVRPTGA